MEALRAAWRRQRAVIRDLKERAAATAALLELPTEKCDPGEKALLLTAAAELSKRQADKGATDYRSFCIDTMARRAGMSAGTYGRKLKRFYTGENRLFDYDRKPLNPDDPLDPRRSIYLRPARESCGTFTGILWTAITTAEARDDTWGGTREPKPIPLCPTHGDVCDALKMSQLVCGGADKDGNLCGEFLGEPTQRLVSRNTNRQAGEDVDEDRNTQDACSPPDHPDSPLPVAIPTQDAYSTPAPSALTLDIEAAPLSRPAPTGRCHGCNDVWTPRKGSDATMCGACRYYAAQQASTVVTA